MATKTFEDYFAGKGALPGDEPVSGDTILVLRSGTVFQGALNSNYALATMEANVTLTTIVTRFVWVPISGTMADDFSTSTFTFAANQYTYIGSNQSHPSSIKAAINVSKIGNGYQNYEVGVFVNGVQVGTGMAGSSENDSVVYVETVVSHALQANDVIDLRVRCTTDAVDCLVSHAQLQIG